jgi:heme oxygenase (mycobilin-producing)
MAMPEPPTLINPFKVPGPGQDETFLAGWERAREYLEQRVGRIETALHRSFDGDADFRFVNVATIREPEVVHRILEDPEFPGRRMPFRGHPMLYRGVAEQGEPAAGGVVFINAFEVPAEGDEEFLDAWEAAGDFLRRQAGFHGRRLHQSLGPQAEFRFVNIGSWQSEDAFRRATGQPDFGSAVNIPFPAHPALYEVIRR